MGKGVVVIRSAREAAVARMMLATPLTGAPARAPQVSCTAPRNVMTRLQGRILGAGRETYLADGRCPGANVTNDMQAAPALVQLFGEPCRAAAGLDILAAGEENGGNYTQVRFDALELLLQMEHSLSRFKCQEHVSKNDEISGRMFSDQMPYREKFNAKIFVRLHINRFRATKPRDSTSGCYKASL